MTEENIKDLFRLIRELNDKFQDMIDELRKENRAELLRCQDAYCSPRHHDLENKVKDIGFALDSVKKTVWAAAGGAATIAFVLKLFF